MSFLLGMLPDAIYFTMSLIVAKNIKEKRFILFLLICISYAGLVMITRYNTMYYFLFVFVLYGILMIVYKNKTQITDIFLIVFSAIYLSILSPICYFIIDNYIVSMILNRILLFIPFLGKKYIRKLYVKYNNSWNRNDSAKRKIKSITLRILSVISFCSMICFINLVVLYLWS